eukprot:symbB.v1.2.026093.t1/scaffold2583.1/size75752/2
MRRPLTSHILAVLLVVSAHETCEEQSTSKVPSLIQGARVVWSYTNKSTEETPIGSRKVSKPPKGWKQDLARIQAGDDGGDKGDYDYTDATATAISALVLNALMCGGVVGLFSFLHYSYPMVFHGNALEGKVSVDSGRHWAATAWTVDLDQVANAIGIDACMAIEYSSFGVKVMFVVGLPYLLLFSPLHRWYGGAGLEHVDLLASLSMANIKIYHPWLYHLHALAVIWVVMAVRHLVFEAHTRFTERRASWARNLPYPRCNTVLVEKVPKNYRSKEKVSRFFESNLGPDSVARVDIVKDTAALEEAIESRKLIRAKLIESRSYFETEGVRPTLRRFQKFPANLFHHFGPDDTDAIDHFTQEDAKQELQIKEMRESINQDGVNSHSAFVTFRSRKSAEIVKALDFDRENQWLISDAPEAPAIRWQDLSREEVRTDIGYFLIFFLFANFSPICLAISSAASEINVGRLQPIWAALAPTLGLTIFLSMLPTALLLIFNNFFKLPAEPNAQHQLQIWYFRFQAVCILLLPIVGTNFRSFVEKLHHASPSSVLDMLADKIPLSSQFFFNFIVLQWSVACMELLRMVVLGKFLLFRMVHTEKEAREMAEPEDQDFYGMGGRTARWSLNLIIGCLFCGVWPLVSLVTLIQFLIQRVAYGFLIALSETRKGDSGGEFWAESMSQLLYSMVLFAVGMFGVLIHRSSGIMPAAIALLGINIAVLSVWQFHDFRWRCLPFPEVAAMEPLSPDLVKAAPEVYKHPALKDSMTEI